MGCMSGDCKGKKKLAAQKKPTTYRPAASRGGSSAFGKSAIKIRYNRSR